MSSSASSLFKQFASVFQLLLDGKRNPDVVSMVLQGIISTPSRKDSKSVLVDDSDVHGMLFRRVAALCTQVLNKKRDPVVVAAALQELLCRKSESASEIIAEGVKQMDTKAHALDEYFDLLLMPLQLLNIDGDLCERLGRNGLQYVGDLVAMPEEDFVSIAGLSPEERSVLQVQLATKGLSLEAHLSEREWFVYQQARLWHQKSCWSGYYYKDPRGVPKPLGAGAGSPHPAIPASESKYHGSYVDD